MYFLYVLTTDFSMFKKEFHFKNSFKMGCARKRLRSLKFHTLTIATSFVATTSNNYGLTYLIIISQGRVGKEDSCGTDWFLCEDVRL